jgi:hypothetical protein
MGEDVSGVRVYNPGTQTQEGGSSSLLSAHRSILPFSWKWFAINFSEKSVIWKGTIMNKFLLIANAALTVPFGIAALIAPTAVFSGFGIVLDPGAQLIARGYAATCIGYGIIFFLLRENSLANVTKALLLGSILFNLIETIIQGIAGLSGTASPGIWGTTLAHCIMTLLSVVAYLRQNKSV